MKAVFLDANETLAAVARRLATLRHIPLEIHCDPDVPAGAIANIIGDAEVVFIDHTSFPLEIAKQCGSLRHIVFLGTGARSYMNPETLAQYGITVHTIKGYGDTAVAEMAVALMWAASKSLAYMDRAMRAGQWQRTNGVQLSGKTLGLIGFGGIAKEVARLTPYMRVLAWNRTARKHPGVEFVDLETLLRSSDVVSLHLLLDEETRGFLSRERLALMKRDAILVNTARGALVDEAALVEALQAGSLGYAALDVFTQEPLPQGHDFAALEQVTLSAHSAFRTPEASENLIALAFDILHRIQHPVVSENRA